MDHAKSAPCDFDPISREAGKESLSDADPLPHPLLESPEIAEPTTAVEAVRYLFLAKELRRLGQAQAADRWYDLAVAWLERFSASHDDH